MFAYYATNSIHPTQGTSCLHIMQPILSGFLCWGLRMKRIQKDTMYVYIYAHTVAWIQLAWNAMGMQGREFRTPLCSRPGIYANS